MPCTTSSRSISTVPAPCAFATLRAWHMSTATLRLPHAMDTTVPERQADGRVSEAAQRRGVPSFPVLDDRCAWQDRCSVGLPEAARAPTPRVEGASGIGGRSPLLPDVALPAPHRCAAGLELGPSTEAGLASSHPLLGVPPEPQLAVEEERRRRAVDRRRGQGTCTSTGVTVSADAASSLGEGRRDVAVLVATFDENAYRGRPWPVEAEARMVTR